MNTNKTEKGFLMFNKNIIYIFLIMSSVLHSTVYEDAEHGNVNAWSIYDQTPAGATITNIQTNNNTRVISLNGSTTQNGYIIGDFENGTNSWNNSNEKKLTFRLKFNETYLIYIRVTTLNGPAFIGYQATNYSPGQVGTTPSGIFGLGTVTKDNTWHTITRDLEADLQSYDANNSIIAVHGFLIRGSGFIDDIELSNDTPSPTPNVDWKLKPHTYQNIHNIENLTYDVNNPEHCLIQNITEFQNNITDPSKRVFFIDNSEGNPTKYIDGLVTDSITLSKQFVIENSSGTISSPRIIKQYNAQTIHPIDANKSKLAQFMLRFVNANNWVVDGVYLNQRTSAFDGYDIENSKNIIFTRGLLEDTIQGFRFHHGSDKGKVLDTIGDKGQWSHDNNSYYEGVFVSLELDNPNESVKNFEMSGCRVRNYCDAFQSVRIRNSELSGADKYTQPVPLINIEGTRIVNNLMYIDGLVRGNQIIVEIDDKNVSQFIYDETGTHALAENAIDLKMGSLNHLNPVIIKNNVMFGYRTSASIKNIDGDPTGMSDVGVALGTHFDVQNVEISNNIIFDSTRGISGSSPIGINGEGKGLGHSIIKDNNFTGILQHAILGDASVFENIYALHLRDAMFDVNISGNNILEKEGLINNNNSSLIRIYRTTQVNISNNNIYTYNNKAFYAGAKGQVLHFETYDVNISHASNQLNFTNNKIFKYNAFPSIPNIPWSSQPVASQDINSSFSISGNIYDTFGGAISDLNKTIQLSVYGEPFKTINTLP